MKLFREITVLACDNKQAFDQATKTKSNAKDSKTNAEVFQVAVKEEVTKKVGNLEVTGEEIQLLSSAVKLPVGKHLVQISESIYEKKIYHKIIGLADVSSAKKSA